MMDSEVTKFADKIARVCYVKYSDLPKTGKPSGKEWTLLAGVVKVTKRNDFEVVALGTGSKCLGQNEISSAGDKLNDSHAEVMARRGFMRYLYQNINSNDIFQTREIGGRLKLKDHIEFHFFTSHTPCGDASIINKDFPNDVYESNCSDSNNGLGNNLSSALKRKSSHSLTCEKAKKIPCMVDQDIHRTGAKCVSSEVQDPRSKGVDYHVVGVIRTKPGRGSPTLSLSCSDKLAKWNSVGCQGALLSFFMEPIFFSSLIVGGGCPFSKEAFMRAVARRSDGKTPLIDQSSLKFVDLRSDLRTTPSAASLVWCLVDNKPFEVASRGLKQGVTKTRLKIDSTAARLQIHKVELGRQFLDVFCGWFPTEVTKGKTYYHFKQSSVDYQSAWQMVKDKHFPSWPHKSPSYSDFEIF